MKTIHVHVKFAVDIPNKTDVKNDLMVDFGLDGSLRLYENGGTRKVRFKVGSTAVTRVKEFPQTT
jgi:hypothetical protein